MAIADSGVKFFRSFRIPILESDKFTFEVKLKKSNIALDLSDARPINISFTGLAFKTKAHINEGESVVFRFKLKKLDLNIEGKIVRFFHRDNTDFIYGVEFNHESRAFGKKFLTEFIESFPVTRLKEELRLSLIETGDKGLVFRQNDFELVIGLARMMSRFDHLEEFVEYLCHELKRIADCQEVSLYFLEGDTTLVRKFSSNLEKLPVNEKNNISDSIVRTSMSKNRLFNGVVMNDAFWNERRTHQYKGLSVIVSPLFDHYGKIVGCIEFENKNNALRFNEQDEFIARFMGYLLTFLLDELKSRAPEAKRAKKNSPKSRKYALVGRSEEITSIRKKVTEHKDSPGHLLIEGEQGVGKQLISDIVRTEGELEKFQLCYLNISNSNDYKVFQSFLEKFHKLQNMHFVVKGFEAIAKKDFELLVKLLQVDTVKSQKVVFHLLYTPPMEHSLDLGALEQFRLIMPPLKDRKNDFYQIFTHFMDKECDKRGLPYKNLSKSVVDELSQNQWPGNVDELKRIVSRIIDIYPYHHHLYNLPDNDIFPVLREKINKKEYTKIAMRDLMMTLSREKAKELLQSKFVVDRYHYHHNDLKKAAKSLGIESKDVQWHIDNFKEIWKEIA